jgi:hypothetical protein
MFSNNNIQPRFTGATYCYVATKTVTKTLFKDLRFGDDILYQIASYLSINEEQVDESEFTHFLWFIGKYDLRSLNKKISVTWSDQGRLHSFDNDFWHLTGRCCWLTGRWCGCKPYKLCKTHKQYNLSPIKPFHAPFHFGGWIKNVVINPIIYITRLTEGRVIRKPTECPNGHSVVFKPKIIDTASDHDIRSINIKSKKKKILHHHVSLEQKQKLALSQQRFNKKYKRNQDRTFERVTKNIKLFSAESCYTEQDYWDEEYGF